MALKGDLASVDLAQVFQMLALNQKQGMLLITAPKGWRALYFDMRGAALYFDEHVVLDKVLLQATRTGRVEPEYAQQARADAAAQGVALADALVQGGYLDPEELMQLIRTEMEEEIYDLFFWEDAHFEFFEGARTLEGRDGQVDDRFSFPIDSLIMEAARRIDEWSYILSRISGPTDIHRPVGNAGGFVELEDAALAVYDLIDGKRNVSRLVEVTGLPPFLVYKGLAVLMDEGMIEELPTRELVPLAQECVGEGRHQDAVNLYERAISAAEGVPQAHEEVAQCYEVLQEFELAAYHRKCIAEFMVRVDDVPRAVAMLRRVVDVLPTDLAARERLVELTIGRQDLASQDFDPVAAGKELVDLYLATGEVDRVRAVLERLLRDNPYDVELKKSLVNVHTKAGDTKRVVELYESIAEDYVQQRRPIDAVKYLQKVLMLDRSRKDISERIRSLYELDERRRSRRRSVMAMIALVLVVVALGGVWFAYDRHASDSLAGLRLRVDGFLESEEFERAEEVYKAFLERYPLTIASREVEIQLTEIGSRKELRDARREAERKQREKAIEKVRRQYRIGWQAYMRDVDLGNLAGALEQLQAVRELVDQAGESEDFRWAEENQIDEQLMDLRGRMSTAMAADRRARQKLEQGDWQGARALWLELRSEYGDTETARQVKLPVRVESQPTGATLRMNGVAMTVEGPAGAEPMRTPTVLLLEPEKLVRIELELDGFETESLEVRAAQRELVSSVLTAVPLEVIEFEDRVSGSVSLRRGMLAAGLRGGQIGLAATDGEMPRRRFEIELPGLDELDHAVAFTTSSALFLTRERRFRAHSLNDGRLIWEYRFDSESFAYTPLIVGRRAILVSREGSVYAFDTQQGGRGPSWQLHLAEAPSGPPTSDGRHLRVGLVDGRVVVVNLVDGQVVRRLRAPDTGLTTSVEHVPGAMVFGTSDGQVVAVHDESPRRLWEFALPDDVRAVGLSVSEDSVTVVGTDGRVLRLGLRTGAQEAVLELPGQPVAGPVQGVDEILVTCRVADARGIESDVMVALSNDELRWAWEYRDGRVFAAEPVTLEGDVYVPNGDGQILRFR